MSAPNFYDLLRVDLTRLIVSAWPEINLVLTRSQAARRNLQNEFSSGGFEAPIVLIDISRMESSPEYSGSSVALATGIDIYYIASGASSTSDVDVMSRAAELATRVYGSTGGMCFTPIDDTLTLDASPETNQVVAALLYLSATLAASRVSFRAVLPFTVSDIAL